MFFQFIISFPDPDGQSPLKKHKKHKHKKHKKKKNESEESIETNTSKAMKMTIKVNEEEGDKGRYSNDD